jgi:hypothetical protein
MPDDARINEAIVAKLAKKDWLKRLEGAFIPHATEFHSADIKRSFLRFFDVTSLNVYFIEEFARHKLPHEMVLRTEQHLDSLVARALQQVNQGTSGAAELVTANGITRLASFNAEPLRLEARIFSPIMTSYFELYVKTDHLLRLLHTLRINRVIKIEDCDLERAMLKRHIKRIASAARRLSVGLRERVNALGSQPAQAAHPAPGDPENTPNALPSTESSGPQALAA